MIRFKNKLPVRENIVLTRRKFTKIALASIIVVNIFLIIHAHEVKATEAQSLSQISHLNENTITNGIGGRAIINNTGSILITKIALPEIKEGSSFKAEGGTLYVYSGFSGQVESDIGFQYSTTYNVWKPIMKVGSRGQETVQYIEGKDNFTYTNGFKPGSEVQLTIYKNLNGATRATYWGISNKGYTGRLISEIKNTNISSVKSWKILSTIAVPRGIPEKNIKIHKNYAAKFKNIVIDNKPVKPVIHATKKANITTNSNNATIEITR
ncbi:YrpD family protein [Photorhabdus heterorhabditis]|uniref:YrpD family protein n=1 Tax=Photorhabdus heterorhabditis TaxID=880156 RepID=UPI0006C86704|nr:YrpD family protein [Photorhabdus heterorhabditis]